jgi:hypothetical protein
VSVPTFVPWKWVIGASVIKESWLVISGLIRSPPASEEGHRQEFHP